MFRQLAQDHMVLYLLLMIVLGLILGVVAIYLILFIESIFEFLEWFSVASAVR